MKRWREIGQMDEFGRIDSPVHNLDPRAKAVTTIAFVATVMSFHRHEITALVPFLLYPVALLSAGRIPVGPVLRKVLLAAPFVFFVAVLNPLLERAPVASIGPIVITGGWLSFASILFRFVLTVGAALTLVACTGVQRLGAGLESMGVPYTLVTQILFLYRYLFLISDHGTRMFRSMELRSVGARTAPFHVRASLLGSLLLRSIDRAERVHLAMSSRGFDGRMRTLDALRFRASDALFVAGWVAFFAVARTWNLPLVLGDILAGGPG